MYLRHYAAVATVCRTRLRDPHLAEDATQETFLRAWKALPNFTHDVNLSHWLRRIARNHCHDLWRSAERTTFMSSTSGLAVEHHDPAAEAAVEGAADRVALQNLLRGLRPRDAALLVDHHAAGLSVAVLAHRWHMTRGAMEVALHRARQRARRCAEQQGPRGVVPLLGVRRLVAWLQRSAADLGGASSPAAAALCNLAVVVVVAAMVVVSPPAAAPARSDDPSQGRPPPAASAPSDVVLADASARHDSAGGSDDIVTVNAAERSAAAGKAGTATPRREPRLVEMDPVPVPVAGGHLQTSPDDQWERTRRYGVRNPVTGGNLVSNTEYKHDPEPLRRVGEAACPATAAAEPVTYCD